MPDPASIARIGSALYGSRWQTELARALTEAGHATSLSAVKLWATGERSPRPSAVDAIRALAVDRSIEIEAAIGDLTR